MSYEISDQRERLDLDWIYRMLSTEAWWGRWRADSDVQQQIDGSWRVVGAYESSTGRQVGFARAVSDGVSFGYLADVIVDPDHRGKGIGKALVGAMVDEGPGALFRWVLFTADAHALYSQFGFEKPNANAMVRAERR